MNRRHPHSRVCGLDWRPLQGRGGPFGICIARTREVVQPHTFPSAWRPLLAFPHLADSLSASLVMCTPACLRTLPCWACPPGPLPPPPRGSRARSCHPLTLTRLAAFGQVCLRMGVRDSALDSLLTPSVDPPQGNHAWPFRSAGGLLVPSLCRHRWHP